MSEEKFDFARFQKEAIEGLYEGKSLTGENGIFAPLLKHFLESALEGEMSAHLLEEKAQDVPTKNRRNGKNSKIVKSLSGEFELETPRDRTGSFEPKVVPKRQVIITEGLEEKVIALYAMGNSLRDISKHIQELYGMELSATQLSEITDKVIPAMNQWRVRPLESLYCFVYLDCVHYKVRDEGRVVSRAVYNVLGINQEGKKDLIGMYVSESEGAKFWLSVLTDLKNRGVEDILITCVDGLKGFPEAIEAVFPHTQIQTCIIHQIRNTMRYVTEKDKKEFMSDLKLVYQAAHQEEGYFHLLALEEKWGKKYPVAVQSWLNNWQYLSTFFDYAQEIRRVIYTTNTIEGFHRQIRKVTKTKGAFTSDLALMKLIYLVVERVSKKWTMPLQGWALTFSQLYIKFEERVKPYIRI